MEVSKKLCHPAKGTRRGGAQEGEEVPKSEGSEGQNRRRDLHATTGGSADFNDFRVHAVQRTIKKTITNHLKNTLGKAMKKT